MQFTTATTKIIQSTTTTIPSQNHPNYTPASQTGEPQKAARRPSTRRGPWLSLTSNPIYLQRHKEQPRLYLLIITPLPLRERLAKKKLNFIIWSYFNIWIMGKQMLFTELKKLFLVPRYDLSKLATTRQKWPENDQNRPKTVKKGIFSKFQSFISLHHLCQFLRNLAHN